MLAAFREIKINGITIDKTPSIIPSFSSKGFPEVNKIIETHSSTIVDTGILVSAYDIAKLHVKSIPQFSSFIVLDSGGYECSQYKDLSDANTQNYNDSQWTYDDLSGVLNSWQEKTATISVSYDHPNLRCGIEQQIINALKQFEGRQFGKLILIKPSSTNAKRVNVDELIRHVYDLRNFDILGLTEKELGYSIYNRMQNIAKIRIALTNAGLNIPIHIFGSLDTISTPLYFISGADIFDGLTWLRYAYSDGFATYIHNYAALHDSIRINDEDIPPLIWSRNYYKLLELQDTMKRYIKEESFNVFGNILGPFFETACRELEAKIHGGNNGR